MRGPHYGSISRSLVGLAALIGAVLTFLGLSHMKWPEAIPWFGNGGDVRFAAYLGAATLLTAVPARRRRLSPLAVGVVLLALLGVATGAAWAMAVIVWIAAAFAVAGRVILAAAGIEDADWLFCFVTGAGTYGSIVGLLAHLPIHYPGLYAIALAAPLIGARGSLAVLAAGVLRVGRAGASPDRPHHGLEVGIAVLGLVYFVVALMPELGHDALAVHMFVPAHLAERHEWGFDAVAYTWAVMPMLGDWLFSIAYMLAGETAARLVNVLFLFALARLVHDLASWAGSSAAGARWAVLIFLSSPMTFTEGNSLFIESPWAMFAVAGLLAILRSGTQGPGGPSWLVIAGFALGFALAAKAVTLTILPVLIVVVLLQYRRWRTPGAARWLSTGAGVLVAFGSLPYVNAWWITANPVYPFMNGLFQSPLWPAVNFDDPWGKGLSWDFPYRVTFQTDRFMEASPGAAGFQWLLVALPAAVFLTLSRHRRGSALVLVAIASVALCFHATAYLRYVFPASAILAAGIGVALDALAGVSPRQARALRAAAALAVALNLLFLAAGPYVYRDFPLASVLSKRHRDEYLAHRLPIRRVIEAVNALNHDRAPVVVLGHPLGAGLNSHALYTNWYNLHWNHAFAGARNKQEMALHLERYGVEYLIVDDAFPHPRRPLRLLEAVTTRVSNVGPISIRRFRSAAAERGRAEVAPQ